MRPHSGEEFRDSKMRVVDCLFFFKHVPVQSFAEGVAWEGLEETLLERTELPCGEERERRVTAENARSRFNQDDWSWQGEEKAKSRSGSKTSGWTSHFSL